MTDPATGWSYPIGLFEAIGVELEYMIVDRDTLDVRPMCGDLFAAFAGAPDSDVEPDGPEGTISWSNELALHVVELKTQRPVPSLDGLDQEFQKHIRRINALLEPMNARLMPTAMHPWMNPDAETQLWPHEYNDVYRTYDRIFGCSGHGWGNLQSTHINLPFANDDEFGRLHAAIRIVLPLLPAIAASSPIIDGRRSSHACNRMEVYRTNSLAVPMMTGRVIPEPVFSRAGYEGNILGRLYDALAPLDPDGTLRHEFANARGAIARFDRGAIEIRILDIQECPKADLAIISFVTELIRAVASERWLSYGEQKALDTDALAAVLLDTIRDAENAIINDRPLLDAFGIPSPQLSARDLLSALEGQVMPDDAPFTSTLRQMLSAGSLASRISRQLSPAPTRDELHAVYTTLADCLHHGELFRAP